MKRNKVMHKYKMPFEPDDDDDNHPVHVQDIITASQNLEKLRHEMESAEEHLKYMLRRVRNVRHKHTWDEEEIHKTKLRTAFLDQILPAVAAAAARPYGINGINEVNAKASEIAINTMLPQFNLHIESEVA
jgi:molecular chaperone GrpE (heat shock protein)